MASSSPGQPRPREPWAPIARNTAVEVPPQVFQREVPAQSLAQAELRAQVADSLDFRIEDLPRQTKRGDAIAQHAARVRVCVEQHGASDPGGADDALQPSPAGPAPTMATRLASGAGVPPAALGGLA